MNKFIETIKWYEIKMKTPATEISAEESLVSGVAREPDDSHWAAATPAPKDYFPFPDQDIQLVGRILRKKIRTHSERVCLYSLRLAQQLNESCPDRFRLVAGALFHDIGKLKIPLQILSKQGALTASERQIMNTHPISGKAMLADIPVLQRAGEIVAAHHERFDGGGYPCGLKGTEIPFEAKVVAVADSFDAMTSRRNYGCSRSMAMAHDEIIRHAGSQFDPQVVAAFAEIPFSNWLYLRGAQEIL